MAQLSASTLKLFQECPRCFWMHINQRVERPRGPFPSLPSGIDRVLKAYFETYRRQGILPPIIHGKVGGKLSTSALTLGFNDPQTRARLWGKLDDCIILDDQRLAPLDHKTRASAPDDVSYTHTYYQFQMDVYTLLLARNGYRTSRTAYVIYYFPVDGTLHEGFPFEVLVHEITTDPDAAYAVFSEACRCLAGPQPEASASCAFCRWIETRATYGASQPIPAPASPVPAGRRPTLPAPKPRRPRRANSSSAAPSAAAGSGTVPGDLFG